MTTKEAIERIRQASDIIAEDYGTDEYLTAFEMAEEAMQKQTLSEKYILDVTCGDRTIWFQKNHKNAIYCDKRMEEFDGMFGNALNNDGRKKRRHIVVNPDVLCDFTNLPFDDESFYHVVFDPPHIENLSEQAWMRKAYGSLDGDWRPMIHDGFHECMRVLKPFGTLTFKWSDISVSTRDIINVIGEEPLYGHRSGRKMNTHWMLYMKIPKEDENNGES